MANETKIKMFSLAQLEERFHLFCKCSPIYAATTEFLHTTDKAFNCYLEVKNPSPDSDDIKLPPQARQHYAELLQLRLAQKGLL